MCGPTPGLRAVHAFAVFGYIVATPASYLVNRDVTGVCRGAP